MEDKKSYHKMMLIVFCLIVVLLCAGAYNYIHAGKKLEGNIWSLSLCGQMSQMPEQWQK